MADLIHLRVESFAGGGMIGALRMYYHIFSNIGSYLLAFSLSDWDPLTPSMICLKGSEAFHASMEKRKRTT